MKMIQLLIVMSLISLTGCASHRLGHKALPQDGPTIDEIYRGATVMPSKIPALPEAEVIFASPQDYIRTEAKVLDNDFKLVYNPTITMYVYPHLTSGGQAPVPGYITKFQLYGQDNWALPGENIKL